MSVEKRIRKLENAIAGGVMCVACFVAKSEDNDGFQACTWSDLEYGIRCGRWLNRVRELSDTQLQEVVTARAKVEEMTFDEYMAEAEARRRRS